MYVCYVLVCIQLTSYLSNIYIHVYNTLSYTDPRPLRRADPAPARANRHILIQ